MSYRLQSDEPEETNIEIKIQISFSMSPRVNNIEYFVEKKEESSLILNTLKGECQVPEKLNNPLDKIVPFCARHAHHQRGKAPQKWPIE